MERIRPFVKVCEFFCVATCYAEDRPGLARGEPSQATTFRFLPSKGSWRNKKMFNLFKKKKTSPDFSEIDSLEKAAEAGRTGALMAMLLMPESFGGTANELNVVYVPAWAIEQKERIDIDLILPLAQTGKITKYSAQPVYKGASFIPSAIVIRAHEPGDFSATVEIW